MDRKNLKNKNNISIAFDDETCEILLPEDSDVRDAVVERLAQVLGIAIARNAEGDLRNLADAMKSAHAITENAAMETTVDIRNGDFS